MRSLNISDIARMAGVSKTTVSRVLNKPSLVNSKTKAKVEKIIKENDFHPKQAARAITNQNTTNVIAVLVAEINNEYFGNLLLGISEIAEKMNITTMIFNTENSYQKEKKILQTLRGYYIKGIIYAPSIVYKSEKQEKDIADYLDRFNVPVVLVDRSLKKTKYDGVFFKDDEALYQATKNFIKKGYKNIGVVSGDFEGSLISVRDSGVFKALKEFSLALAPENYLKCNYTVESAYRVTLERFQKADPPSAFILGNNKTGLGFLKAINEKGLKLNKDIYCVGIDKIPSLEYIDYGYSFVERDSTIMGKKAMQLLAKKIEEPAINHSSVYLPAPLIYYN